jgi:hypothetical protein
MKMIINRKMMRLLMRIIAGSCVFVVAGTSTSFQSLAADLEQTLNCDRGSVQRILEDERHNGSRGTNGTAAANGCLSFVTLHNALEKAQSDNAAAALSLLLDQVQLNTSESRSGMIPKNELVKRNSNFTIQTREGDIDDYGCVRQSIIEKSSGTTIGSTIES